VSDPVAGCLDIESRDCPLSRGQRASAEDRTLRVVGEPLVSALRSELAQCRDEMRFMVWPAFVIALAFCPLASWALLARTRPIGALLAVLLGMGAVLPMALAFGWLGSGHQAGVLLVYVLTASVVVWGGVVLERRQIQPRADELISWRRASGWLLLATFIVGFGGLGTVLVALTRVVSAWLTW
jgi:hypothetical protein